ncbi:hypothetical protein BGZ70_004744 [Mortierella alpina]|uniref:Uncharacterized protein n=1 Tax=Mortierella alpina TaxID=64518 RepID=A0A9P6JEI4_MORAP|nr:hypothetical protein BGZ70_004744 [Mortierella alpina]
MKLSASVLLISAALATIASAAPLLGQNLKSPVAVTPILSKRCNDCTHVDGLARDLIIRESATHYSNIAYIHLDGLSNEIQAAKVTSGAEDLPREKEMLSSTVQIRIDDAKRDCAPEALAQAIENVVTSQATFDIPWSNTVEIEKKMAELDVAITQLMLERIQNRMDAELPAAPETPAAAVPETSTPAALPDTPAPAPAAPAPAPAVQPGINVATTADPKYVCKSGCTDSQDATHVLTIRVNMEKQFKSQLSDFSAREVPTACTEQRSSLLGTLVSAVTNLKGVTA